MRISDWSSDVCSSDLLPITEFDMVVPIPALLQRDGNGEVRAPDGGVQGIDIRHPNLEVHAAPERVLQRCRPEAAAGAGRARKGVGEGKGVEVSGDLGCSRAIRKKKNATQDKKELQK